MTKKPQKFNIVKHTGQLNKAYDPSNGKTYERTDMLFVILNEQIQFVKPVYDPDHFVYQRHMPLTEAQVKTKYLGILPKEFRGPVIMCTCGAEAVIMLDGPYANMAICKSIVMYEKHQTSFKVSDGQLILDKHTQDNVMLTDAEIQKNLRSNDEERAIGI